MFTSVMTADEFREWRTRLILSQSEAALLLGISTRCVSYYETGGRNIDWRTTVACHAFEEWPKLRAVIPAILERIQET